MKHSQLRKTCFCLAALLLSGAVTACGGTAADEPVNTAKVPDVTESQTEAAEESKYTADYLPEVDYGGYEFRMIDYAENAQYIPEETGNIVEDAVYKRNRLIEEQYNVKFTAVTYPFTNYEEVSSLVKKSGTAASDDFDLATLVFRAAYNDVLDGIIPAGSQLPVADLSQPWHVKSINDSITVDGVTLLDFTAFDERPGGQSMLFNKKIVNDFDMENPYTMVDNGTWTSERMLKMGMEAVSDINGNGTYERGDRFGFIGEWDSSTYITYIGTGHMLVNIVDGIPTVNQEQLLLDAFELFQTYTNQPGFFLDTFQEFGTAEASRIEGYNLFKQGQSMFVVMGTSNLTIMGDMLDDYGVLPFPKWSEEQDRYYVNMDRDIIAVPLSCSSDLERVCTIKEALAVESMNIVYPAFYDNALKNRYVRDEDSIRMLEIITNSVVVDLGQSPWWDIIRAPWMDTLKSKKNNFASAVEKNTKKANTAIDKMMECIAAIKENS